MATASELESAALDPQVGRIFVAADIEGSASIRLQPGQHLLCDEATVLRFAPGQDGVELTSDNLVRGLDLVTDPRRRALFNAEDVETLGSLRLDGLRIRGCVRILVRGQVRSGHVEARDIHVAEADARHFGERPSGFGVEVVPGAFTLWNLQEDEAVVITANLTGISAGRADAPVRGSGVFVGGFSADGGGRLRVSRLETGEIHSHGGIAEGTADRISGGVFTVHGAVVESVRNAGTVTTYGPNDMVLDNWGRVERWVAEAPIASHGPSAIGFVNFGTIGELRALAPIETYGTGARGLNVYAGTIETTDLERVATKGDGAVGIQISQPIGRLTVRRGIETAGGTGMSLVKGVMTRLSAIPLSIKPGGSARFISISGGLVALGEGVPRIEFEGEVDELTIATAGAPDGPGAS